MAYLKNTWYCAAWSHEISRQPLARTLLDTNIVLYRKESGDGVIALNNVCPHRFAPLDGGKLHGDALACPYHGLRFGEQGHCVHNPHDDRVIERLTVTAYPIVERDGIAWIWMGEKDKANSDLIPNFDAHSDTNFQSVYGLIAVNGNYQLVSDNLLDLSHTQYLHAALAIEIDEQAFLEVDLIEKENTLTTTNNIRNGKKNPFAEFVWPDGPERIENYGGLYWSPPANMNLKVHMGIIGEPEEQAALQAWGAELVTPETETSCHYFWSFARNYRQQDTVLNTTLQQMISSVFEGEDATIIAKVQKNMGTETDLLTLKPVILSTDSAAVRARRILDKLIKTESSESC